METPPWLNYLDKFLCLKILFSGVPNYCMNHIKRKYLKISCQKYSQCQREKTCIIHNFLQMDAQCPSPDQLRQSQTQGTTLAQTSLSKSSGQLVKTIPRISISNSLHESRNTRSLEHLHLHKPKLEIPTLIKSLKNNQIKTSLVDRKLPVQNCRRLSVNFNLSNQIEANKSASRRPSVFSQVSDRITTSTSRSNSNCSQLARRKNFISGLNLFFIRSILVVTLVIFVIFIYKFYTYLSTKDSY
jgi:hypothetical protein